MRIYYLYRHIRLDKNEPFYVGIGTCVKGATNDTNLYLRANTKYGHNDIWNKIVNKTNYLVEVMYESDKRQDVMDKEVFFIKLYGRMDLHTGSLCNLTEGGEGVVSPSKETRAKAMAKRGKEHTKWCWKPVHVFNEKGELLQSFNTMTSFQKSMDCDYKTMERHINKKLLFKGYYISFNNTINTSEFSNNHKSVFPIVKKINGNVVASYRSVKEAGRNENVSYGCIQMAVNNKKPTEQGVVWEKVPFLEYKKYKTA